MDFNNTAFCECDSASGKCRKCGVFDLFCGSPRACPATAAVIAEPPPPPTHGPGTELSRLLKRFGIEPTPTCQCRAKQQEMDALGPDECSKPERIDEVVAVMREEATARGLPFLDVAGRMLVRRAIANARRNA